MNNSFNRFTTAQTNIDIQRSKFNLNHSHKTTFMSGKLVPIDLIEVMPGDSMRVSLSSVIRSITPVVPVMDDAYFDVFAFYVPNRIATAHPNDWQKIIGENLNGFWAPDEESTLDNTGNTVKLDNGITSDSLGCYYGLPICSGNEEIVSFIPF